MGAILICPKGAVPAVFVAFVLFMISTRARAETAPDPEIALALAQRKTRAIELPPAPVVPIGRCAIVIWPRPNEVRARVLAEFQARNGGGWRQSPLSFSTRAGTLRSITEPTDGPRDEPLVHQSDAEAKSIALDFVVKNFDLFGLTADDLLVATTRVGPERDDGTLLTRTVELMGERPQPGYEAFPSVVRRWRWTIWFGRHGQIRSVVVQGPELLPSFSLCTTPLLPAGDPKVVASVIGHVFSARELHGEANDPGAVTAEDIRSVELTIFERPEKEVVTLRLAYHVKITKGHLPWGFIVDADTGALIVAGPEFVR